MYNNKTDLVSYNQAVRLKELGFDWKVNNGYSVKLRLEPEVSYGEPKEVHSNDPKNFNDNRKGADKGISFCSAPTMALAAKWLRDVKGIAVNVIAHDGGLYQWEEIYLPNAVDFDGHIYPDIKQYDTYEQALSAGLDSVLTLLTEKQ